jgi:Sulfotransferase family
MASELKPPIILFGNFRSGTTMIQRIIAKHPDVVPLYEPVGLWLYADPGRSHDEFDEADATDRVKRYIRDEFLKVQESNGGRIVAEKTPHNILRIPYVRAIFPEAHFIYIVRNPLSFISSVELKWQRPARRKRLLQRILRTPVTQLHHYLGRFLSQLWHNRILGRKYLSVWGPRYEGIQQDVATEDILTVIARQWARSAAKAEQDLARFEPGQVLAFRYEDFVRSPVEHVSKICAHCRLQMTDEMADYVRSHVKTDRNEKWQRFEPEQLAKIIPEISVQMERLGYAVPDDIARATTN